MVATWPYGLLNRGNTVYFALYKLRKLLIYSIKYIESSHNEHAYYGIKIAGFGQLLKVTNVTQKLLN